MTLNVWLACQKTGFIPLNSYGEGVAIKFPVKVKPPCSWSQSKFVVKSKKLIEAPRVPIEKIMVTLVKRACNIENFNVIENYILH